MKDLTIVENLLVIIDVVNGFINEGAMADKYINRIVPGIDELTKEYIYEDRSEVFFIRDCHKDNCVEFAKFPAHCVEGTSESEVVDELKKYQELARTYLKNSTSAIFAKGLLEDLEKMDNLKKVVVVGCCSDICVLNFALPLVNYFDENDLRVKVEVREDLIETYNSPSHDRKEYNELTIKLLKQAGVEVTNGGRKNER